jgi:hypothetical protein
METLRLEHRVTRLEKAAQHRPPTEESLSPLTDEEREVRWQELQHRAALGDPGACWRVERVNMFLARAKGRQNNEYQKSP